MMFATGRSEIPPMAVEPAGELEGAFQRLLVAAAATGLVARVVGVCPRHALLLATLVDRPLCITRLFVVLHFKSPVWLYKPSLFEQKGALVRRPVHKVRVHSEFTRYINTVKHIVLI